jgi:hypothetical protein
MIKLIDAMARKGSVADKIIRLDGRDEIAYEAKVVHIRDGEMR